MLASLHAKSTCTRKVLATLAETNTPYEFTLVDFAKGEHKAAAHLARQPFGQVPAINDDGFALYESRAIIRYINDKAGGNLVPTNPQQRALMDQWMSVETSNFTPHAMKFVYHYIFGRPHGEDVLAAAEAALNATLAVMEKQFATTPYLTGAEFTLADICYLPYMEYAMATPAKLILSKYDNVMAWWQRCSERPSWQKTAGRG
ncbi:MAG TPA: glutathione binding-like protein [Kofleriaceae bacterium]|nr:glutathione binding-like protein [Kofleriaceae bacterium]